MPVSFPMKPFVIVLYVVSTSQVGKHGGLSESFTRKMNI